MKRRMSRMNRSRGKQKKKRLKERTNTQEEEEEGDEHQHFKLVNNFTVTENIILGMEGGLVLDTKNHLPASLLMLPVFRPKGDCFFTLWAVVVVVMVVVVVAV